ncbi:MAG TPA: hypothetical protein VK932_21225 [Kofleriaceae bacterium]|nr:hypothetical protein [Kofleriaceae bacterium]
MKRTVSIVLASLALASLTLGGIASCKQGEGERCQVQEDCEEGLTCNIGEGLCREVGGGDIPAPLPPDAPLDTPPDGPDAPLDAPPDAP